MCSNCWTVWRRERGAEFVSLYDDPVSRFWAKVDKRGPDECWPWLGSIEQTGYGHFQTTYEGVRFTKAHRFAHHVTVGPIPVDLDLDHTCHTRDGSCRLGNACPHRRCCNPAHTEPVSERINVLRSRGLSADRARRTHCGQGHELTGENLLIRSNGGRRCRACKNAAGRRQYSTKKKRAVA
jgi:hypothetical protein